MCREIGIDRPLFIFLPDLVADDGRTAFGDGLLQSEALISDDAIAETFVGRAIFISARSRRSEPTFVDAAAIQTERIQIVGVKFEAFAWLQKRARHPTRREAQQSAGIFQRSFDGFLDFVFDSLELVDVVDGHILFFLNFGVTRPSRDMRKIPGIFAGANRGKSDSRWQEVRLMAGFMAFHCGRNDRNARRSAKVRPKCLR